MTAPDSRGKAVGDVVELLTTMISNACVNDGSPDSGQEIRNVDTLTAFLGDLTSGAARLEFVPGRTSLVVRFTGTDPEAPSLCLMGHTDVVPASARRWTVDPFEGRVEDGVVWGRGALDMLNQTAAMAGALRRTVGSGFTPRGDLVFFAAADEEAGGKLGAEWILDNHPDAVACDYVITEGGGFRLPDFGAPTGDETPDEESLGVMVAEKGPMWRRFHFDGVPGHASIPRGADNALAKAADAITRLHRYAPPAEISGIWHSLVDAMHLPDDLRSRLVDAVEIDAALDALAQTHPTEARIFHSCTHNTFAPNVARAGEKTNVTAAHAEFELDARVLPGTSAAGLDAELRRVLGDLFDAAVIEDIGTQPATQSPVETDLWKVMAQAARATVGPCRLVPWLTPFATDARFFRMAGTVGYGFTLHDSTVDLATWLRLFHGDDERVSIEAIAAATELYERIIRAFLA